MLVHRGPIRVWDILNLLICFRSEVGKGKWDWKAPSQEVSELRFVRFFFFFLWISKVGSLLSSLYSCKAFK